MVDVVLAMVIVKAQVGLHHFPYKSAAVYITSAHRAQNIHSVPRGCLQLPAMDHRNVGGKMQVIRVMYCTPGLGANEATHSIYCAQVTWSKLSYYTLLH